MLSSQACTIREVDASLPRPRQTDGVNVTSVTIIEDYEGRYRGVTVIVSFSWTQPVIDYGILIEYDIYLTGSVSNVSLNTVCSLSKITS